MKEYDLIIVETGSAMNIVDPMIRANPKIKIAVIDKDVLVGFCRYEDAAKGEAMAVEDCFVKVIVHARTRQILGAHIVGPEASILIQEIINVMSAANGSAEVVSSSIHIHPAMSEVVQRAFGG